MSCSVCAEIPDAISANTGRDVYLPPSTHVLKSLGLGSREDLRVCPACYRAFFYQDEQAWTGSGNNDEESLTAYSPADSELIDGFVRRDGRSASDVAARLPQLLALRRPAAGLVLTYVERHDRELRRALLPVFVGMGLEFGVKEDEAAEVLALIGPDPKGPLLKVAAACTELLCRSCCEFPGDSPLNRGFYDPTDLRYHRLEASADLDFWQCKDCPAAFCYVRAPSGERLVRLQPYMADAMRACLKHELEGTALVFASDKSRLFQVLLAHGLKRDAELLRLLMPRLLVELANRGEQWLYDWLLAYALRGDAEWREVREAAERIDVTKHYQGERAAALARDLR